VREKVLPLSPSLPRRGPAGEGRPDGGGEGLWARTRPEPGEGASAPASSARAGRASSPTTSTTTTPTTTSTPTTTTISTLGSRVLDGPYAGYYLPALGLLVWEVASRLALVPAHWLPAPSAVLATLGGLARGGELAGHVATTLARVAVGFALGAAAGTALGAVTGHDRRVHRLLDPTLQALRAIPSMAWAPLFLLWLGIHESSKTALIALGAFFPVYLNLASGIRAIDPKLVEVGRVFRLSGFALVRRVLLPATLPAYLTGLRSGLGLAWMFVVAAEIMGASRGLGYVMIDGQTSSRADLILASLLLFAALGKASDSLLMLAGRRFQRGGDRP
jgi:sulfonate transport system permease protein